ncbi:response regulator transcription factor [Cupriavidus sp. RAF12]|uniref:response regulator transcription factor n=1 Tax=Cupriavidus sp. RAF12 TaxID=3233050 RepID=UPI003F8F17E1
MRSTPGSIRATCLSWKQWQHADEARPCRLPCGAAANVVSSNPERSLSPRELEVVRLYVNGMTMTEVARHPHCSVNTVSTQKGSAMRELGLSRDAALFDYAVEHGMRG